MFHNLGVSFCSNVIYIQHNTNAEKLTPTWKSLQSYFFNILAHLNASYSSNTIEEVRLEGYVSSMGEIMIWSGTKMIHRHHSKDQGVDGRIKDVKWEAIENGFIWLRIRTSGGLL
jgi:hypothetical protein